MNKNNKAKKTNDIYSKNMFNSWNNNNTKEEKTNPIINSNKNYSLMDYGMWLSCKNYDENCSTFNNTYKISDNKINKILEKNKIKAYMFVIVNSIFSFTRFNRFNQFN